MQNIIYTGYYANIPLYLKHNLTLISISGRYPTGFSGLWWKFFAPSWDIFSSWKKGQIDNEEYTNRFCEEILSKLNFIDIKQKLDIICNPILLCYEKEGFCHRHIVADWLRFYGLNVKEFK